MTNQPWFTCRAGVCRRHQTRSLWVEQTEALLRAALVLNWENGVGQIHSGSNLVAPEITSFYALQIIYSMVHFPLTSQRAWTGRYAEGFLL